MVSFVGVDISAILGILTTVIDLFAVTIIAITVFQPFVSIDFLKTKKLIQRLEYRVNRVERLENYRNQLAKGNTRTTVNNLIKGMLLALEFESANAIIKLGIYTTNITLSEPSVNNSNDFVFFVSIILLRVAINQSLRRFDIGR